MKDNIINIYLTCETTLFISYFSNLYVLYGFCFGVLPRDKMYHIHFGTFLTYDILLKLMKGKVPYYNRNLDGVRKESLDR